jgi:hypothetical protein
MCWAFARVVFDTEAKRACSFAGGEKKVCSDRSFRIIVLASTYEKKLKKNMDTKEAAMY